ncbi:MAG TPA: glutamate-cysteine ligase family protein, partial [Azospirillaceae bacterium]|nr:glutamate-cysteine ligase family protein [Azospirillaceae bacterium]
MREPAFTLGVEEEYLLVDRASGDIAVSPPEEVLAACQAAAPGRVHPEFLRCQIEVGTEVCQTVADARRQLAARHVLAGDYEAALEQFMDILR